MPPKAKTSWPPVPIDRIAVMGAVVEHVQLDDPQWVYEPKYDGIRVKTMVLPGTAPNGVHIWSRQGNSVTGQFPDLVHELDRFRMTLPAPILTDGEIVATDTHGTVLNFGALQGRLGLLRPAAADVRRIPVSLILFDILLENGVDLRPRPLITRRRRLERLFGRVQSATIRVSRLEEGDGRALYQDAVTYGWEACQVFLSQWQTPFRLAKAQAHSAAGVCRGRLDREY